MEVDLTCFCRIPAWTKYNLDWKRDHHASSSVIITPNIIEKGTSLLKYEDKVRKLRSLSSSHKQLVFPPIRGQYQQLDEYFSIQEEFPGVYGIGLY